MVICSIDFLKKSSKKKETGIGKKLVEVLQLATDRRKKEDRKVKDRNDEIVGFDVVFIYWLD